MQLIKVRFSLNNDLLMDRNKISRVQAHKSLSMFNVAMSQLLSRGIDSEIAKWIKRIHLKWNSETKTRFDEYMTLIPEAIGLRLAPSHKIF